VTAATPAGEAKPKKARRRGQGIRKARTAQAVGAQDAKKAARKAAKKA
jgi:hypothetical protein